MDGQIIILLVIVGALSGFLAGLLGIGGGFILVPPLFYLFQHQQMPPEKLMHVVIATSLAVTSVTTLASTFGHYKKKAVNGAALGNCLAGLLLGCICGAFVATLLPSFILKLIFGCMIFLIGLYFIFFNMPSVDHSWPLYTLNFFGFAIGNLSSILGIGGGIFSVPLFLWYKLSMRASVATSSSATLATVWVGSLTYLILAPSTPFESLVYGYIYLPAFATLSIASILTVHLGVKAAHSVPVALLRRIFGIVLALTGVAMLFSTGSQQTAANSIPAARTFFLFERNGGRFFDLKIDLSIVKPGR